MFVTLIFFLSDLSKNCQFSLRYLNKLFQNDLDENLTKSTIATRQIKFARFNYGAGLEWIGGMLADVFIVKGTFTMPASFFNLSELNAILRVFECDFKQGFKVDQTTNMRINIKDGVFKQKAMLSQLSFLQDRTSFEKKDDGGIRVSITLKLPKCEGDFIQKIV